MSAFKNYWNNWNIAERIMVINVGLFVLGSLIPFLFQFSANKYLYWFELSQNLAELASKPWSILSYSFFHLSFSHLFWNMILLWVVSRMFLNLFNPQYFINVYFLGALSGGVLYLLSYQLFPVFTENNSSLIGASAAVMAILIFICSYTPNREVRVFFFNVKLWQLGAFLVLIDLMQIPTSNAGGHIAHLGGAFLGFIYARRLLAGKDIGEWFAKFWNAFAGIFKRSDKSPLKTVHKKKGYSKKSTPSKSERQNKIDSILDKISRSGYDSLSSEEKDFLFKAGKDT